MDIQWYIHGTCSPVSLLMSPCISHDSTHIPARIASNGLMWNLPGLVNMQKANWKITIFKFGKSTISMGHGFNSYVKLPEGTIMGYLGPKTKVGTSCFHVPNTFGRIWEGLEGRWHISAGCHQFSNATFNAGGFGMPCENSSTLPLFPVVSGIPSDSFIKWWKILLWYGFNRYS